LKRAVERTQFLPENLVVRRLRLDLEDRRPELLGGALVRRRQQFLEKFVEPFGRRLARNRLGSLLEPVQEKRQKRLEEVLLALEVIVERPLAFGRFRGDILHRQIRVAVRTERSIRRLHNIVDRLVRHSMRIGTN